MSQTVTFGRLAALIGLALAADLGLAGAARVVGLPLALDSLGTALAGALGGPVVGLLVGLGSGALVSAMIPGTGPLLVSAVVHATVGGAAAAAHRLGGLRRVGASLAAGGATGIGAAAAVLITGRLSGGPGPVAAFLLGGGRGATALAALGVAAEVVDKAATFVLAGLVVTWLAPRLPGDPHRGGNQGPRGTVAQVPGDP